MLGTLDLVFLQSMTNADKVIEEIKKIEQDHRPLFLEDIFNLLEIDPSTLIADDLRRVEKEYEEMDKIIETTHEMNLPEYSEDDYNNDKRINTTKKVVKKIGLTIGKLCISSIPAVLLMIDNFCRMRLASIEDGTTDGELLGNIIGLLPASLVWYFSYKIMSV